MYTIAQIPEKKYCNYFSYSVQLIGDGSDLRGECIYAPVGVIAEKLTVAFKKAENTYILMSDKYKFKTIDKCFIENP